MSASIRCSAMQAPSRDCCIGDCLDRAVDGTGASVFAGEGSRVNAIAGASVRGEAPA